MGAFVMITGMYSNIQAIVDGMFPILNVTFFGFLCFHSVGYRSGGFPSPFSCINRGLV